MSLILVIILYFKIENKFCKTFNFIDEPVEIKMYEMVGISNRKSQLPKI